MLHDTVASNVARERAKPIDPMTVVDDNFMSNAEIAEKFGISVDLVYRAQDRGELIYCSFGFGSSRSRRVTPRKLVLAWAASRLVGAGA